ncbi:MAG TPA: DUF3999 family protein [Agriterribacter sp.]|nr:DUF3999 family protein [Agriterribacter sp.]
MKLSVKLLSSFLLLACSLSYGQIGDYGYKRELTGITEKWHKMILPDTVFGKLLPNLNDIRIFGITAANDTVEAPYLLRVKTEKITENSIAFQTLNASYNAKGYYFTFENPAIAAVNQIKLEFKQQNFDWRVTLQGSHNQDEWFTIVDDYRIVSIKNNLTDFRFTTLNFPGSKYRYFRLFINSKEKPALSGAGITQNEITAGEYRNYPVIKFETNVNKESKQTEIDIALPMPVPLSFVQIKVKDSMDYYRPVTIQYLADSFKTERGWKYNYVTLTSGVLNSIEENEFKFEDTHVQILKILIENHNNAPLTIDSVQVKGYQHELVVRFTEKADYFMVYGNSIAAKPRYDIDRFAEKIPATLTALTLGKEQSTGKQKAPLPEPLFKNKAWLWIIMAVIILLLGWFSVKMMRRS